MRRIISLALVAAMCLTSATSCKHSGKEAQDNLPVEETETVIDREEITADGEIVEIEAVEEPEEPGRLSYSDIEVKPVFQDGDEKSFQKWIADNVQYPSQASDSGQEGTVVAQFTVDREGRITDVKVLRSVSPALDAEAVRVIESAPSWTPGSHDGEAVDVSYVLPVKFEIK